MSGTQTSPESAVVSEAPSSSEDSDCEQEPEPDTDFTVNEEWAEEILSRAGVVGANEVRFHFLSLL